MEKQRNREISYDDFLLLIRHAAQLEILVRRIFNLSVSKYLTQDASINDERGSYLRMPSGVTRVELIERTKQRLYDDVLGSVEVPAQMDWEDFSELVTEVVETVWQHIEDFEVTNRDPFLGTV